MIYKLAGRKPEDSLLIGEADIVICKQEHADRIDDAEHVYLHPGQISMYCRRCTI